MHRWSRLDASMNKQKKNHLTQPPDLAAAPRRHNWSAPRPLAAGSGAYVDYICTASIAHINDLRRAGETARPGRCAGDPSFVCFFVSPHSHTASAGSGDVWYVLFAPSPGHCPPPASQSCRVSYSHHPPSPPLLVRLQHLRFFPQFALLELRFRYLTLHLFLCPLQTYPSCIRGR